MLLREVADQSESAVRQMPLPAPQRGSGADDFFRSRRIQGLTMPQQQSLQSPILAPVSASRGHTQHADLQSATSFNQVPPPAVYTPHTGTLSHPHLPQTASILDMPSVMAQMKGLPHQPVHSDGFSQPLSSAQHPTVGASWVPPSPSLTWGPWPPTHQPLLEAQALQALVEEDTVPTAAIPAAPPHKQCPSSTNAHVMLGGSPAAQVRRRSSTRV